MDIKELVKAVENSDMESEAKAEVVEIIEDWENDHKTVKPTKMDWVKCGSCGQRFYIPSNYHGQLWCPYCRQPITQGAGEI